jgi:hypothetical protein
MDIKYTAGGIVFLILGIIMFLFHQSIGDLATRFSEKFMNITYNENVRKGNKKAYLILGLFFVIFGLLLIFHKISLR